MTRRLIVRSVAERDLLDAHAWYEERATDLGADFLQRVDLALIHIARHPLPGIRCPASVARPAFLSGVPTHVDPKISLWHFLCRNAANYLSCGGHASRAKS
jgi:hypothetical protein